LSRGAVARSRPAAGSALAFAAAMALTASCHREFQYREHGFVDLARQPTYYIVWNARSVSVVYDYTKVTQDYDTYAAGRSVGVSRSDVPLAIADDLYRRGKRVLIGPEPSTSPSDLLVVRYRELWGWDMGDIIKALSISVAPPSGAPQVELSFSEMSIVNSHPTAASLVPQMMALLFKRGRAARLTNPPRGPGTNGASSRGPGEWLATTRPGTPS
jgi:hypothetical protein